MSAERELLESIRERLNVISDELESLVTDFEDLMHEFGIEPQEDDYLEDDKYDEVEEEVDCQCGRNRCK